MVVYNLVRCQLSFVSLSSHLTRLFNLDLSKGAGKTSATFPTVYFKHHVFDFPKGAGKILDTVPTLYFKHHGFDLPKGAGKTLATFPTVYFKKSIYQKPTTL